MIEDATFRSMGCDVRLLVPAEKVAGERAFIEDFAARLTRFSPESELSALNSDVREVVPASRLLRAAVAAGLWAARVTHGLVDPTLLGALERAGYRESREGARPVPLRDAVAAAPARRPASARPDPDWQSIEVDDQGGAVARPAGVRFDTGGTGKGLCADAVAVRLGDEPRFVVDCGGDIAVRGEWEIDVEHPLTGVHVHKLLVDGGGVATSGLNIRIWRRPDGSYFHHLLDPSTGEPAWTGLIGATAVAGSALEAETLSKQAVLSGPGGAREVLAAHGGVLFHDDGEVEVL